MVRISQIPLKMIPIVRNRKNVKINTASYYLDFVNNVEPFITVISKDKKDASFIYTDRIVDSYSIDSNYYLSNKFKAYLSSANTMVGKNIDMLNL